MFPDRIVEVVCGHAQRPGVCRKRMLLAETLFHGQMKLANELRGARNIPPRVGLRIEPVHAHEEDVQGRAQDIDGAREAGIEFVLKLGEGLTDPERIARRHGEPRLCFRGEKEGKIEELARGRCPIVEKLLRK